MTRTLRKWAKSETAKRLSRELTFLATLILVVLAARSSLADHYHVPSGSMLPTLQIGDHVLVNKLAYGVRVPFSNLYLKDFNGPLRGDVVVVFGNAEISGRVDGNVVVVFGNLLLDESAEVTSKIVSVGGRLDQDPAAEVGDVVSVDLLPGDRDSGLLGYLGQGILPFLMCQGTFLLTLILAVIAVAAAPQQRFESVLATLRQSPGPSLGVGLVTALVGHLAVAILMVVLILTVIGVPLALLVFLALIIVIVVSVAVCGAALGSRICRMLGTGCSQPWLTVVVGMAVLHMVSFLGSVVSMSENLEPIADTLVVLGVVIKTLAFLFGLGALTLSRFGSKNPA